MFLTCVALPSATAGQRPVFIEKGVCPGEGCVYGVWRTVTDVALRPLPDDTIPGSAAIGAGELVCALTGEVHTMPGRFVVERRHGRYAPEDTISVYTYRGEGWFLVEFEGERYEEDLGFSPWGGTAGTRCESGCWGHLEEQLDFDWWIRIDNLAGVEGWASGTRAFDVRVVGATDPAFFAECRRRQAAIRQSGTAGSESAADQPGAHVAKAP